MLVSEDNSWRFELTAIVFSGVISITFLTLVFGAVKTDFEAAEAFGAQTTTIMAVVDGRRIHCGDERNANECIAGFLSGGKKSSILWLGNSQLHAVNQFQFIDKNAPLLLFEKFKESELDLITFSQPNANLQEHWILYEYLVNKIVVKKLILPIVFDDMREDDIRPEISSLYEDRDVSSALSRTKFGLNLLESRGARIDNKAIAFDRHKTPQDISEEYLNSWLESNWRLWDSRAEIRGQLMGALYKLRNKVLGINPSTKRKMIRGSYQKNIQALELILKSAHAKGVEVLVYIAPIRNDVEIPYLVNEYDEFKGRIVEVTKKNGAIYANLENLIPAKEWGYKNSTTSSEGVEVDYMHFNGSGHKIMADQLYKLLSKERGGLDIQP